MAVLTVGVKEERLRDVDAFAKTVSRSREDIVDEAIDRFLRKQEFERVSAGVREAFAQAGITEKHVEDAIREACLDRANRK
jgi:predicted transcriptional regulator